MKRLGCLIAFALLALSALATSAGAAESETGECVNLADCTPVADTPWVVVPAAKAGFTEPGQQLVEAGTTLWRVDCPSGRVPAGRDYNVARPTTPIIVTALVPPFNIGVTASGAANFFAYWQVQEATSFQPLVGCVPKAAASSARAASGSAVRVRTITRSLRPGQTKTILHRCGKGERLVGSAHGVAFYKDTPPSARELRELRVSRSEGSGRVVVRVRTGPHDGDDEHLAIQVHAFCR